MSAEPRDAMVWGKPQSMAGRDLLMFETMDREEIGRLATELEPWVNGFEYEGVQYARGSEFGYLLGMSPDRRAGLFFEAFPQASRILELGALEGGDTVALASRPGTAVLALEGREENLRRAEFVIRVHGLDNAEMRLADVETIDFPSLGRFDAVLCAGLLYHVREPWTLLRNIGLVSDNLLLSTHYWGTSDGLGRVGDFAVKQVREDHPEPQARGLSVDVGWLDRASLTGALAEAGFTEVDVVSERTSPEVCDIVAICRKAR